MDRSIILTSQLCYIFMWSYIFFSDREKITLEALGLMLAITMLGLTFHKLRDVHQDIKEIENDVSRLNAPPKINDTWHPN